MNKPMIVSDEYREGYAAFLRGDNENPYYGSSRDEPFVDWEHGWLAAQLDWFELIDGEKSV